MSLLNIPTPQNKEAEFEVLGCLINNSSDPDNDIFDLVTEDDFYGLNNKAVYQSVKQLRESNQEVNHFTVMNLLKQRKDLDGQVINSSLFGYAHYKEAAIFFVNQLKQKSMERKLIEVGDKIALLGQKNEMKQGAKLSIKDLKQEFNSLIESLDKLDSKTSEPTSSKDLFSDVIIPEEIQGLAGVSTGFYELDAITGGWQEANLILIAGRPGMGKTAFVINSILRVAKDKRLDGKILFYSLEQSKQQLAYRCLSIMDNQKSILDIKKGNLDYADRQRLQGIREELKNLPVIWYEPMDNSFSEFERVIKRTIKKEKISAIFIDHIGQFSIEKSSNLFDEMSKIAGALQNFCRVINIPVIALTQLNRGVENRTCKKPQLSDLRQSGRLEETAWIILFLYRDEYYNQEDGNEGEFTIIVAKNKDGPCGEFNLMFNKNTLTIKENEADGIEFDFNG